jgi:hypothetical protein
VSSQPVDIDDLLPLLVAYQNDGTISPLCLQSVSAQGALAAYGRFARFPRTASRRGCWTSRPTNSVA